MNEGERFSRKAVIPSRMSAVAASNHTSLMLAGYACSTALVGWLSDRMRRRRPIMLGSSALYLACWGAWLVGVPDGWTYPLALLMGIVVSGFSLSWSCAKEVNAPSYAGMATSVANLGGFVTPFLVGAIKDATGSTANGMYFLAALLFGGAVLGVVVRFADRHNAAPVRR